MRVVQYYFLKKVLNKVDIPDYLYAFEKGRNVVDMANIHVSKPLVISIDIKDFFPSVRVETITKIFEQVTDLGKDDAKLAAELVTYKYFLPQGGITSPKVSNLVVAFSFGPEVKQYCNDKKLNLTIYADDLTVSSDAPLSKDEAHEIYRDLSAILAKHKFKVKRAKTKFMRNSSRQTVCGIVVNEKLNLDVKTRKLLRSMVHHYLNGRKMEVGGEEVTVSSLKGRLNWYSQLGHPAAAAMLKQVEDYENAQPQSVRADPVGASGAE